jgi:lipopolysaccharide export LptBFGC system permease protein LptF
VEARSVTVRVTPDDATRVLEFDLSFSGAAVRSGGSDEATERETFRRSFTVTSPPEVLEISSRSIASHRANTALPEDLRRRLDRELVVVSNGVYGELNSRAAFALSCLVLVLVGVALGMMFRSGNFLSAFAISVVPAMICILLTVTGQHTVENVPTALPQNWSNPLSFGLGLIWTGNAVVAVVAVALLYRLQRQ